MFLHELLFDKSTGCHRTDEKGNQRFPEARFSGQGEFDHRILFDLEEVSKADQCAFYNLEDYKVARVDVTRVTSKNPAAVTLWLRPLTPLELDEQKRGYSLSHTSL